MKARRKRVSAKEAARQRRLANLREPWKPGQSGNPKGKPPGTGSVVSWLKHRLSGPPINGYSKLGSTKLRLRCLAHELSETIIKRAQKGDFKFIQLLVEKTESQAVTEEQVNAAIDRFHNIVKKYVRDPKILEKIARDMHLELENEDE